MNLISACNELLKERILQSTLGKRIARNFSIITAGSMLILVFGLLRTTLIAKNLSVYEFGLIGIALNLLVMMQLLLHVRVNDLFFRFIPEFEKQQKVAAVRSILFLGFLMSLAVGLLVAFLLINAGAFLANSVYSQRELAALFPLFAAAGAAASFVGFFEALLRLRDRYSWVLLPQVIAMALTVLVLFLAFRFNPDLGLREVCIVIVAGQATGYLPPLAMAVRQEWNYFRGIRWGLLLQPLYPFRRRIYSTVFHTKLMSSLKLGSNEGGVFLLAVIGSPQQVAYVALAQQLIRPLKFLQENLYNVLTPEIPILYAQQRYGALLKIIRVNFWGFLIVGASVVGVLWFLVEPLVLLISSPEYLPAGIVCILLGLVVWSQALTQPLFPVALAMDRLAFRNVIVAVRFVYLGIAVFFGLTAVSLMLVQLAGSVTTRLLNDLPLYRSVQKLARGQTTKPMVESQPKALVP